MVQVRQRGGGVERWWGGGRTTASKAERLAYLDGAYRRGALSS